MKKWLLRKKKHFLPRNNRVKFHDFKRRGGYLWQQRDSERIINYRLSSVSDCEKAASYCAQRRICVQAGGHSGLYPKHLSELFEAVYTFEPDHLNAASLAVNTLGVSNIYKFQAALGEETAFVDLNRSAGGSGSNHVEGAGHIPMLTIDLLDLPVCDLIYLDIEGYELPALRGAKETIAKYRPVIALEDNGLSQRFGITSGDAIGYLETEFGYVVAERSNSDVIMVHGETVKVNA